MNFWRRVKRIVFENFDVAICFLLIGVALRLLKDLSKEKPDEAIVFATLAGALFGGGAILLGNWIARANERLKTARDVEHRREQLKTLITAELVNVAAGLIGADEVLLAARATLDVQGGMLPINLVLHYPRDMPFTFALGIELCIFEQPVVDAIVTLRSNLSITRENMIDAHNQDGGISRLQIAQLLDSLRFTMGIVAQVFDKVAPARKLQFAGKEPKLFSEVLRNRPSFRL